MHCSAYTVLSLYYLHLALNTDQGSHSLGVARDFTIQLWYSGTTSGIPYTGIDGGRPEGPQVWSIALIYNRRTNSQLPDECSVLIFRYIRRTGMVVGFSLLDGIVAFHSTELHIYKLFLCR